MKIIEELIYRLWNDDRLSEDDRDALRNLGYDGIPSHFDYIDLDWRLREAQYREVEAINNEDVKLIKSGVSKRTLEEPVRASRPRQTGGAQRFHKFKVDDIARALAQGLKSSHEELDSIGDLLQIDKKEKTPEEVIKTLYNLPLADLEKMVSGALQRSQSQQAFGIILAFMMNSFHQEFWLDEHANFNVDILNPTLYPRNKQDFSPAFTAYIQLFTALDESLMSSKYGWILQAAEISLAHRVMVLQYRFAQCIGAILCKTPDMLNKPIKPFCGEAYLLLCLMFTTTQFEIKPSRQGTFAHSHYSHIGAFPWILRLLEVSLRDKLINMLNNNALLGEWVIQIFAKLMGTPNPVPDDKKVQDLRRTPITLSALPRWDEHYRPRHLFNSP